MKQKSDVQADAITRLSAQCEGPDQFENFDRGVRASLSVPKEVVMKEEARQKRVRAKKRIKKSA